jgi:homoserine kinase
VISGAGPTVLVLARDHVEVEQIAAAVPAGWRCEALLVDSAGAHLVPAPRSDGAAEL